MVGRYCRNKERTFGNGYLLPLPHNTSEDITIDGIKIEVDKNLTGDDLKKAVVDFVNNSGNGTIRPDGNIFAKIEDTGNVLHTKR